MAGRPKNPFLCLEKRQYFRFQENKDSFQADSDRAGRLNIFSVN
jgi:hypothetical protein